MCIHVQAGSELTVYFNEVRQIFKIKKKRLTILWLVDH